MGYNNEHARRLVFDLETVSLVEAQQYLDPPKPPKNYKDPAKISAYLEEALLEQLDTCSLDPDLCQIVAVGWLLEGEDEPVIYTRQLSAEAEMIAAFWRDLEDRVSVGYNSLAFDLPVLLRRSLYLGIEAPILNLDRYRTSHLDLMQRLSFNGLLKPSRGLAWYCRRFGIDIPDPHTGADIVHLVADQNWSAVREHCRADVLRTEALARRLGLLVSPAEMAL